MYLSDFSSLLSLYFVSLSHAFRISSTVVYSTASFSGGEFRLEGTHIPQSIPLSVFFQKIKFKMTSKLKHQKIFFNRVCYSLRLASFVFMLRIRFAFEIRRSHISSQVDVRLFLV